MQAITSYRPRTRYSRTPQNRPAKKRHGFLKLLTVLVLAVIVTVLASVTISDEAKQPTAAKQTTATQKSQPAGSSPAVAIKPTNACASNTLAQLILVSISQRHLWACNSSTEVYDSAVVTGMENLAADLTPVGTYHIYAKETGVTLKGSDSTGSWDDYVYYWMPFLDNQYGAYGFHDATWRPANAFGNISPYSSNASHGCVECPLATAKWLYGWASVGTTVTIES
jgi:lipoprotein-anchoring transpeptidase ErfK/SrfK